MCGVKIAKMSTTEVSFYPKGPNIGRNCSFWANQEDSPAQCCDTQHKLLGRTTCRSVIDDVCLFIIEGREPSPITKLLLDGINVGLPDATVLPPGQLE